MNEFRHSDTGSVSFKTALVAGTVLMVIAATLVFVHHAQTRRPPLSVAQQCLLLTGGYVRVSPAVLRSRINSGTHQMLIHAKFSGDVGTRYGLCVLTHEGIDDDASAAAVASLIPAAIQSCMEAPVRECRDHSTLYGPSSRCRPTVLRPPEKVDLDRRIKLDTCQSIDRNSPWMTEQLRQRFDGIGSTHELVETW